MPAAFNLGCGENKSFPRIAVSNACIWNGNLTEMFWTGNHLENAFTSEREIKYSYDKKSGETRLDVRDKK